MGNLTELDSTFYRLLIDASFRRRYLEDATGLGVSAATISSLSAINLSDLSRLARAIRRGVASGSLGGAGVEAAFSRTIELLSSGYGGHDVVLDEFLASPQFRRMNAVGNEAGICAFEAFYDFCVAVSCRTSDIESLHRRAEYIAQHEFCEAILRLFAATPSPAFRIDNPIIRTLGRGHIAILDLHVPLADPETRPSAPVALAAVNGRFWKGRIPDAIAMALAATSRQVPGWAREAEDAPGTAMIIDGLIARGLL
jgi:hypothetical protein